MITSKLVITTFVIAMVGCKTVDPYIATGETLHVVGQEFVSVGLAMNKGLDNHTVTVEQYRKWVAFAVRFKPAYAIAVKAWEVGDKDTAKENIIALAAELSTFAPLAVQLIEPTGGDL